jgi:hypothetical protein
VPAISAPSLAVNAACTWGVGSTAPLSSASDRTLATPRRKTWVIELISTFFARPAGASRSNGGAKRSVSADGVKASVMLVSSCVTNCGLPKGAREAHAGL